MAASVKSFIVILLFCLISREPVDTSIFLKQGDVCLLQMGSTLPPGASVKFSYAWDPPFIMFPESAAIVGAC
ncbi:hypothetical protein ACFX2I_019447 [Malus domestica]|uniref:Uncharacterized protein n=1 Tax=Malus domestica TaxID=3750 RepID=A0A498HZ27_MALDO|nr:hypothetical protein DVH24_042676 [Malus domestica]